MIRWNWSVSRPGARVWPPAGMPRGLPPRTVPVGVAQGYKTYFLQDGDGQMKETHSVAAGLDYVGVSPILVIAQGAGPGAV